jgi:DNA-directed RNA polymerase
MEYTQQGYDDKLKAGHQRMWDKAQDKQMVIMLSRYIWEAIDQVVVKGKVAMDWLSSVAREWTKYHNKLDCSGYDKRMSWVTPDGFQVVQFRSSKKKHQQDTYMNGRVRLTYYDDTPKLDSKDMALSVAPNFVHSLDATHLRMAVNRGIAEGITDFAMIHDSFGVHAAQMPKFITKCVKPSFVDMYTKNDPLADLYNSLPFNHDLFPQKGDLDIEGVFESEFFFS